MKILTIGDLRKIINHLEDDYKIEMRVRRKLNNEELKDLSYPYPYETQYTHLEFDGVGVSDRVLCLGTELNKE